MLRRIFAVCTVGFALVLSFQVAATGTHAMGYHWRDRDPAHPRGYVYWVDNTGAEWPVYSSAVTWDQAPGLDALYTTSGASCPSHCVPVNEHDLDAGCTGRLGVFSPDVTASNHLTSDSWIRIDRQCDSRNYADRRELVCHEMGHSIGLDDRPETAPSCMRQGDMVGEQYPADHDWEALGNIYDHNDPG